jgi:pimeloyl-ACP methyl ester carboxylesterase
MNTNSKKIFIIHGWTYTLDGWNACVEGFRTEGFEPVQLRVPGLTEPSDAVWTLDMYVEWLHEKLTSALATSGEKNITLVAHSNGGRIAIAFIAKYPGIIGRLVLMDSAGVVHTELWLRTKNSVLGAVAKIGKKIISPKGAAAGSQGSLGFSQLVRKIFYRLIGAKDYERAPENMRATMAGLIKIDLVPELTKVTVPTLIIWGKKDSLTPVSDAYVMHKGIAGSKLIVIPDAGHSPHMSHPALVIGEIVGWLKGN